MSGPLPLTTLRLRLRLFTAADREALHGIYRRPEVARFLLEEPWDEAAADRQIETRLGRTGIDTAAAIALAIEHDGALIGDVALWLTRDAPHDRGSVAEIGWVLSPDHSGHGYAREAVAAVLDLALDHHQLHRVVANMDARNTASARLAEAVGMRREAHLRQDWWSKGEWTDTFIYAMLRSDRG